ncbi:uncharacterized protein Z518_03942 [Rhinocladiella mackenziei CBS 650.93]|uniref:Uncharacterized protein n=1 Tax=Rhinocladiella mackenziei CBS 650.93 TaxID=1442369 RepID=A0A0D2H6G0_9EURO|nr:uncharacterized protein Z518_03942 [Rhinocladiella mackenziei CBS 650.93]KIX05968.1 hypothetical protein Z518_03942 [Rhinocladiella mackenziei CBS 650.93]
MALAQQSTEDPLSFGRHYAVLNLDLMSLLIDGIRDTAAGQAFISNCIRWNDAVHQKDSSATDDLYKFLLRKPFAA